MSGAIFQTGALSDECEMCLDANGLHSLSDPKDQYGLARIEPRDESVFLSKFEVTPSIDAVDLKALLKFGADEYERSSMVLNWLASHGRKYGVRLIVDKSYQQTLELPSFVIPEIWEHVNANAIEVQSIEDDLIHRIYTRKIDDFNNTNPTS